VRHRTSETRLDNFFSWFAASVLVTAGIIYGLKLQDDRHQRPHAPVLSPRATPAQEPLTLQQLRAVERGRGRGARTPSQIPWRAAAAAAVLPSPSATVCIAPLQPGLA
jgi:hypothetical protein